MIAPLAGTRSERIRAQIQTGLPDSSIDVVDESHLHVGHAGAREGKGHFRVRVVSSKFAGLRPLQRHQLIYRLVDELMQTEIHALNIVALTPEEADLQNIRPA
jgi:BolA protein